MNVTQVATLHTSAGDIRINLFGNHTPRTVANFVELATGQREWTDPATGRKTSQPLYDGTIFHRVINGFMIQGGDPLGRGTGGPGYNFDDEIHTELAFDRPYLLAMANAGKRMDRVSGKMRGTNGSQFFISVSSSATAHLTGKHTIFGEVADDASRKVVDTIIASPTDSNDRPLQDVTINSVTIEAA